MQAPEMIARLIADALANQQVRPAQIVDQLAGSQVAPATGSSGGTVTLSDATPEALGLPSSGTASEVSRSDHVHPLPTAGDVGAAAALWHGHSHRVTTAVTLPAEHSLWLARLEIETGGSVSLESGAVLQLG